MVADLVDENAQRVAGEITADGGEAFAIHVDVAEAKSALDMAAAAIDAYGGIDHLVNNAGFMHNMKNEPLITCDLDYYRRVMDVNLNGALHCTRAVYPAMAERGGGSIVNQSSTAAWMNAGYYCLSKAANNSLTACLAAELGPMNIHANAIAPGPTDTEALHTATPPEYIGMLTAQMAIKPSLVLVNRLTAISWIPGMDPGRTSRQEGQLRGLQGTATHGKDEATRLPKPCAQVRIPRPLEGLALFANDRTTGSGSALAEHDGRHCVEHDVELGDAETTGFEPHRSGHDARGERRDALDDLRDEDVGREGRLVTAHLHNVDVGCVVPERIRTVDAVVGLPPHDLGPPAQVGTDELFVVGGAGVGPTREVRVLGEQLCEDVEVALVVVEPPPSEQLVDRGPVDPHSGSPISA